MAISRAEIKYAARDSMRRQNPSIYFTAAVYLIIIYVINLLIDNITGAQEYVTQIWLGSDPLYNQFYNSISNIAPYGHFLLIALSLMSSVIGAGFTMYCLHTSRNLPANVGTLFECFGIFFKIVWLYILQFVFVTLWSFLLLVPGIIASLRYSQSVYIMLDNPELSALQCISASKQMMKGRKAELFILNLSFIGWALLAALPIVGIFIYPYMDITYANFYNVISGKGYGEKYDSGSHGEEPPQYGGGNSDDNRDRRPPWEY